MRISDFLKRENNNLDLIRIILACTVIIGHSPILNGQSKVWIDPIGHFFEFTYSGALAVKLFFFISGLVVTNSMLSNKSPLHFVVSRFFRLIPALFFVLVVTVFVFGPLLTKIPLHDYYTNLNHLQYIRHNLVFNLDLTLPGIFGDNLYKDTVNGSLWSLKYEVGCYIFLLGLFLILANKSRYYLNIPIAIIIIDTLLPTRILFSWLGDNPEVYLLPASFAFGAFFAVNADKIKMNLGIVLGSFLIYYVFSNTTYAQIIFTFASCNTIIYLASNGFIMRLKPKVDISYGIYLWGFLIQQSIYNFSGHIYVGFHCFIALIISIILASITYILVERPFMNIGKITIKAISARFPTFDIMK